MPTATIHLSTEAATRQPQSARYVQVGRVRDLLRSGTGITAQTVSIALGVGDDTANRLLAEAMRIEDSRGRRLTRRAAQAASDFVSQVASATGTRKVRLVDEPTQVRDWSLDRRMWLRPA